MQSCKRHLIGPRFRLSIERSAPPKCLSTVRSAAPYVASKVSEPKAILAVAYLLCTIIDILSDVLISLVTVTELQ